MRVVVGCFTVAQRQRKLPQIDRFIPSSWARKFPVTRLRLPGRNAVEMMRYSEDMSGMVSRLIWRSVPRKFRFSVEEKK